MSKRLQRRSREYAVNRTSRGFTVFLTGLPGAGKSSIAVELRSLLQERDTRCVTLLDGDFVRKHISKDLGFSKQDRDTNVLRVGRAAERTTKENGIAICALVAPYCDARKRVRALVEAAGARFLLVHVATPLAVCEARDHKGLYAKARAGNLAQFTGISDPYEVPVDADLVIDTGEISSLEASHQIALRLQDEGCLRARPSVVAAPSKLPSWRNYANPF